MSLLLDGTLGISATGNIAGGNVIATGNLIAANFAPASVSTTGNITGSYIIGNGSQLTGLPAGYANSDVATYLSSGTVVTNILTTAAISATGNITGNYLLGNGSQITGLPAGYTNANVSTFLAAFGSNTISTTGSITAGNITVSTGNVTAGNIVNGNANGVGNIGSSTTYYNTVFAKATSAVYADLAEMYCADANYAPGTVVDFGGEQEVTHSTQSHSTAVAGIVSTNPSYLMNATLACENSLEIALVGRVPCRVVGTFNKGDRLVASDIAGVATRLDMTKYQPGCIVGKALEAYDSQEVGVVEVAVGRI